MRAAHAIASSREGSSSTVKPPLSGGAHEYPPGGERAIGRDEHRRDRFVDTAAEDIYAGGFCFVDYRVCVATNRLPFAIGYDHRCAWK